MATDVVNAENHIDKEVTKANSEVSKADELKEKKEEKTPITNGNANHTNGVHEEGDKDSHTKKEISKPKEPEISPSKFHDESDGEMSSPKVGSLEGPCVVEGKRERKKVQRLSHAFDEAHKAAESERVRLAQASKAAIEGGRGTALGDIPIIESCITKSKPFDLKFLHQLIFGRPGSAHEIRSRLRKFSGFSFKKSSPDYEKKLSNIAGRNVSDIKETLRILNLEVGGSREQISERLLDFLVEPDADQVKYKGKLPPSKRKSSSKSSASKAKRSKTSNTDKEKTKKSKSSKTPKKTDNSSDAEDNESESDMESDEEGNSDDESKSQTGKDAKSSAGSMSDDEMSEASSKVSSHKKSSKKKSATPSKASAKKRRAKIHDEDDEDEDDENSDNDDNEDVDEGEEEEKKNKIKAAKPSTTKTPKSTKKSKDSQTAADKKTTETGDNSDDDDDDIPLVSIKKADSKIPTDEELKKYTIEMLKKANLETMTLRLAHENVIAKFPGADLSEKKDFIKTVVKQFLAEN